MRIFANFYDDLCHQVLSRGRNVEDNENLDLLTDGGCSRVIFHLRQTQIYLHHLLDEEDSESYRQEVTVHINVALHEPIRSSLPWGNMLHGEIVDPCSAVIFFPRSSGRWRILDINRPLSYYKISHDDAVYVRYETSLPLPIDGDDNTPFQCNAILTGLPFQSSTSNSYKIARAKYDWDGKIMHPSIKGLPLERNTYFKVFQSGDHIPKPGWLFGSPLSPPTGTSTSSRRWLPSVSEKERGYFPKTFVSTVEEDSETADDTLEVPPLPLFYFPPAKRMTFHMPISDKGHSFLKITANYELVSPPADPTHVTITLLCSTHDIRRITSVSLFIKIYETTVLDVEVCDNEAHREEIHIDKEVTESRSRQTHFDGVNIGSHGTTVGFQGGMSRGHSIGSTEKGSRVSRRKVDAGIYNDNTVFWNLKAPTTRLDEDGLTGEESITFTLTKKPVQFKYICRVTHSRDGVEGTAQRVSRDSLSLLSFIRIY